MAATNKHFQNFLKSPTITQRIHDFSTSNLSVVPTKKSANLTNFLTVYFNFAYVLCCCPFRFISDEDEWFTLSSALPQRIICGFLNTFGVLLMLTHFRTKISATASEKNQNPLEYFSLLSSFFSTSFQVYAVKRFWTHQHDIVNIVNFIHSERDFLPRGKIRIQNKLFSQLICAFFAVMPLYEVIWKKVLAPSATWNKTIWNRALAAEGRYVFFITDHSESTKPLEPEQLTGLDYFLGFLVGIGWIERYILGFYIDLFMLFAVLTVWTTCYLFSKQLENELKQTTTENNWSLVALTHSPTIALTQNIKRHPAKTYKSSWSEVYKSYQTIRELCELVNTAIGTLVTIYLADCLLFQSTSMDSVLITSEWRVKARLLFFICNYAFVFVLSADACNQVENLKYWLAKDENRREIPLDVLNMVMSEIQTRLVGIRGSKIFTVTYPLLWNMTTTVVTYFIICLQTRQQVQQKDTGVPPQISVNCTQN